MEDILTSNVFGMFMYHAQPKSGLFRFLARATTIDGNRPLASLVEQDETAGATVEYDFWPQWENCEPDLELDIRGKSSYLVGVEAKYWSGKSSRAVEEDEPGVADQDAYEPNEEEEGEPDDNSDDQPEDEESVRHPSDQLAKEWENLVVKASKFQAQPVLIYLTADLHCPKEELLDSIKDCGKPSPGSPTPTICWLSWRELPGLFRGSLDPHLAHLAALAEEMELTFFEGFSDVGEIHADWTFRGPMQSCDAPARASFDGIGPIGPIRANWTFRGLG